MLKKILIIAGIIVEIALFILLIKFSVADTADANKEKQKPLITKEENNSTKQLNK